MHNGLYNISDNGIFPVISTSSYTTTTKDLNFVEQVPILFISSSIHETKSPSVVVDVKPVQLSGKCEKSKTTGWCSISGRKCKCEGDGPVIKNALDDFKITINRLW